MLAELHFLFRFPSGGDHHATESVPSHSSDPESKLDEPSFASEDLFCEFTAELCRHTSLQGLQNCTCGCVIVCKLLRAIVERDACTGTHEFVVSGFVIILEATPSADIVNEDSFVFGLAAHDIFYEVTKSFPTLQCQAAFSRIFVGANYDKIMLLRIFLDSCFLVRD